MHASSRLIPALATLAALTLVLAACTGDLPDPAASGSASATPEGPSPDDVVATRTLALAGADVEARVHPLVRTGEHAVLTVDLVAPAALDEDLALLSVFGHADPEQSGATAVRLLDLDADVLHKVAVDAEQEAVGVAAGTWENLGAGKTLRVQLAYAAPASDRVAVLLPTADLVDGVPVVDGDVPDPDAPAEDDGTEEGTTATRSPSPSASGTATPPIDLASVVAAEVLPLETFTHQAAVDVRTAQSTERITVALGSDVLFASESADLTPEAQAAVALAAEQLRTRGAGTVSVVGHTDAVASDASNLDLSQRRAASVAAALTPLLDPAAYPLEVSGKGESEPVAGNDTEEGRQANRRVELTLVAERTVEEELADPSALPPAPALTATGAEGVLLDAGPVDFRVRASRARLVDGHLVVPVEVTNESDADGSAWGPNFFEGGSVTRGGVTYSEGTSMGGLHVLQGGTAVHPLDYPVPYVDRVVHTCACEIDTKKRVDPGQTAVFTVVYPAIGSPATVTLQRGTGEGDVDFRLTDIPVEQG